MTLPAPSVEAAETLRRIFEAFDVPGTFLAGARHGSGHINETYAVQVNQAGTIHRFLFQRLNTSVFRRPAELMGNIERVTAHLSAKISTSNPSDASRRSLALLRCRDGRTWMDDPELGFWRGYRFIEGARTVDVLEEPVQAYHAAHAFGTFQRHLLDYQGPRLVETIEGFHDTRGRFEALRRAAKRDPLGRAAHVQPELEFAARHEDLADRLLALKAAGAVPERITHNDTKLNNVMLDDTTGEGICILDLDTVMPGLSLYDFGDLVRTACNPVPEDHPQPGEAVAREDVFLALAEGYLKGVGDALLPVEREHLTTAGELLTFESGLRFLTDHLEGDVYFRIHHPGHNLDRARTQFALLASLQAKATSFQKAITRL
jgi:hypothetical protein